MEFITAYINLANAIPVFYVPVFMGVSVLLVAITDAIMFRLS